MQQVKKNGHLILASLLLLGTALAGMPVIAENVTQTISLVSVDVQKLSSGYRASKIIGTNVVNDANDTIGKIDDLIVSPDDNKSAYVVISVGGWLGMGTHMVALPYESLKISNDKILLPVSTKDQLKNLPEFKYRTM